MARKPTPAKARPAPRPQRKLIAFEPDILRALTLLARDRMQDFQSGH